MVTIGEEFAVRWLHKNRCADRIRHLTGDECAELAERVAEAVDEYVEEKRRELDRVLRGVVFGSLDDGGCQECVPVRARDLVASRHLRELAKDLGGRSVPPGRSPWISSTTRSSP